MTVGGVLSEAFALYRRFFARFFLTAAAVFIVLDLFSAIAADAATGANDALTAFWSLVGLVVSLVGSLWVQGALTATVADVRAGRPEEDISTVYQRVRPTLWPLLLAGLLAGIGIFLGLLLLIVPGVVLLVHWVLVTPVVVLERLGPTAALRRSWQLVRGHAWKVLGVILVTVVVAAIAQAIFVGLFTFLPDFLRNWIGGLVANSVTVPFVALAWTLVYFHLRAPEDVPAPEAAPA